MKGIKRTGFGKERKGKRNAALWGESDPIVNHSLQPGCNVLGSEKAQKKKVDDGSRKKKNSERNPVITKRFAQVGQVKH